MAAGALAAPGTDAGPCLEECAHRDCAATRRMAALICPDCTEPIGYDTNFYRDPDFDDKPNPWDHLVHAACLYGRP